LIANIEIKKIFKKALSFVCVFPLILSNISDCSADQKRSQMVFVGRSWSGKNSIISAISSTTFRRYFRGMVKLDFRSPEGSEEEVCLLNLDSVFMLSPSVISNVILAICVEVGDIRNVNERCEQYSNLLPHAKKVILVVTKVDDDIKRALIPTNIKNVKTRFPRISDIVFTSSKCETEIEKFRKYVIEITSPCHVGDGLSKKLIMCMCIKVPVLAGISYVLKRKFLDKTYCGLIRK